jgi:hypothetical protein
MRELSGAGVPVGVMAAPMIPAVNDCELETILEKIAALQLGCPLVLDDGKPFVLDGSDTQKAVANLRGAVGASAS